MDANEAMLDPLGIAQHHDAITGTETEYVAHDYSARLSKGMKTSQSIYKAEVADKIKNFYGIDAKKENIMVCETGEQNGTVVDCPVNSHKNAKDFIVVVHNQQIREFRQFIRIKLPSQGYKAQLW